MRCPTCQTENPEGSKFCRECGGRLSSACAACGTPLTPGSRFCVECGAPQPGAVGTARAAEPPASAGAPAPASGSAQRRLVSVLFADLVGFTTLAEGRDPEETRELLGRYFDTAREVVSRYGGVVEKFIGDAVMAAWGTPTAHEDDAERAVRAALDLVEAAAALGEAAGLGGLSLRAGVMTGEAAVTIGAEGQGMLAGDLVNTASRLQSVAEPGSVLVGEATRRATEESIRYEAVGDLALKGKELPVAAWRADRVVARRRGEGRSDRVEPPFVGRDSELRLLKDLFHTTGEERRARLVSIMGQGGIGKSRLAWELLKYVDGVTELAWWHHGRSPAYGDGIAFWALGEMVRGRAGIGEGEPPETSRRKLDEMLDEFVSDAGERDRVRPHLEALLGLASTADGPAGSSNEGVFAAWRTLFERISERGTVVMVFEDLHWADSGLLDFIEHVLDWSRGHPILILALARPELLERRSEWGLMRRNAVSLPLEPLPPAAMRELLAGLVPGLPPAATTQILERAEGIPLYAVETVRMLVQDGRLERVDGIYRPAAPLAAVEVPPTLHALIAARLDTLDETDRRLLQAASVLGKTFTLEALAAIAGDEPAELEPRLRELLRREILQVDADPRSPERGQYGFVQALIREVAYGTLGRRDRRRLHLAAARHFEAVGDEELSGVLALHYVAAHEAEPAGPEGASVAAQARVALRAAADRAARLGAPHHALGYLRQALQVTTQPADRAELLERAALTAGTARLRDEPTELAAQAVAARESLGDRPATLRARAIQGRVALWVGSVESAVAELSLAATEYADLDQTPEYAELLAELSRGYMRAGRNDDALVAADRGLPVAERLGLIDVTLETIVNRATALSNLGRHQEAMATMLGAIRLAQLHGLPSVEIRAIVNLSHSAAADEPRVDLSREGLELVKRYGLRQFSIYLLSNRVETDIMLGAWDEIVTLTEEFAATAIGEDEAVALRGMATEMRLFRGEGGPEAIEALYGQVDPTDPQVIAGKLEAYGRWALAEGRLDDAYDGLMRAVATSESVALSGLTTAGYTALWLADDERARAVVRDMAARAGRILATHRRIVEAGLAALEGRTADALAGFREARQVLREVGLRFPLALSAIAMARVLGLGMPDVAEAVDEARAIIRDELRAPPLLRRLDEALAAGAGAATGTGRSDRTTGSISVGAARGDG